MSYRSQNPRIMPSLGRTKVVVVVVLREGTGDGDYYYDDACFSIVGAILRVKKPCGRGADISQVPNPVHHPCGIFLHKPFFFPCGFYLN